LTGLGFTLQFPSNQLTGWSISSTNIAVGAASLQSVTPTQAQFSVSALTGRLLQGPANLAEVCFEASGAHSTFVPLALTGVQGTKSNGTSVGNSTGTSGQLAVVAAEPLLQAGTGTNAVFILTLYGNPGSNYVIQSSTDLSGNHWQSGASMTLSNIVNPMTFGGNSNPPAQFYRAYQQ
jgi:hypothetical protein